MVMNTQEKRKDELGNLEDLVPREPWKTEDPVPSRTRVFTRGSSLVGQWDIHIHGNLSTNHTDALCELLQGD